MKLRNIKRDLKGYIRHLLKTFEMFEDTRIRNIILHSDSYFRRGSFTVKDIPFRYEMNVVNGEIDRVQIHIAMDLYYRLHGKDNSEEVKEMKMYLHELDAILVGRIVDKSTENGI